MCHNSLNISCLPFACIVRTSYKEFLLNYFLYFVIFFCEIMGKVKQNYYVPKKTNRAQRLRESVFKKKILVLQEHSYASWNAGGGSSRARSCSVCSKRSQDQEKTNTLLSNMISPVSQDQANNCVIIESVCYENEHDTPIMDEIISTGIIVPLDINVMEENNQSTSGANPLKSEQDPAMSISPDEQLHEFPFISQEEYNEVNEHIIEVERTPRPDSTVIQGNRIVDLEYVTQICMELQFKHSQRCTLGLLKVHREIRNGLVSTIVFCCNKCNFQTKCHTQKGLCLGHIQWRHYI